MDNQSFHYITTEDNGMKITLEFPANPQDDSITSEVKSILAGILNEYLENLSETQHHRPHSGKENIS